MSLNKRVNGNFLIESVHETDVVTIKSQSLVIEGLDRFADGLPNPTDAVNTVAINGDFTIDGNLIVLGDTSTVSSTDTSITDNIIVLNSGETGPGVSALTAGIDIDRGTADDVSIRYNDTADRWEATDDGTTYYPLDASIAAFNVVDDLTPELGGDLDVGTFKILTTVADTSIRLVATGTGSVKIYPTLKLQELVAELPISSQAGQNKIYAAPPGEGGTGLYVVNTTTADELISKSKALVYSIIF